MLENDAHLLLIESDPEVQHKLKLMLSAHYALDVATDAATALTLDQKRPDLVLVNVTIGKPNWADVREVRKNGQLQSVPIIVYSSRGDERSCLEAIEAGASDCLVTPFSERLLLARIRAQLRSAQTCADSFRALRDSEEELRANFELAGIGQAQVDPKTGQFLRVNPRFSEMVGYSPEELRNMTFWDITHPEDRPVNSESWQSFVHGDSGEYTIEKRYIRKDGAIIWAQVTATVIRDADGQPLRTV